jgi:gluconate 2-dehydrogenase subunit 3-like protein
MSDQLVTRRKSLKYLGLLAATAAGQEFLTTWLASSSKVWAASEAASCAGMPGMRRGAAAEEPAQPYTPQFFKPDEFATVEILTEMIIPTDDKPGAKEAHVANYIDFVVFSAAEFEPSLQRDWSQGLAWLAQESQKRYGESFRQVSPSDREQLLTDMSLPERDPKVAETHPGFAFYRLVKDMTVEGFFTSRVGLVGFLEYQGMAFLSEFAGCTHPEHQR